MTTNNDSVESLEQLLSRVAHNQSDSNPGFQRRNLQRLLSDLKNKYQPHFSSLETANQGDDQQINDADEFDEDLPDPESGNFWAGPSGLGPAMENQRHPECAQLIEVGVIAQAVLDGEWALPTSATTDELTELAALGQAALEEMLLGNLRLALYWATRASRGDPDAAQDLFQDACFGLSRAIQGWDWLRGYTFSTYATWHVRQAIQRSAQNSYRTAPVHIPIHTQEALQAHRRDGSDPEGAALLAHRWMRERLSWDQIVEEVPDLVSRTRPNVVDDLIDHLELHRTVLFCLAIVTPDEAEILARRHGLLGDGPQTLDDIGRVRGVTRERIRQLEGIAISKLKLLFAGIQPIRRRVIRQMEATQPALAQFADTALDRMCLTSADIKKSLGCNTDLSKQIALAITVALDNIEVDTADLPTTWVPSHAPAHLKALLTSYEPTLSLQVAD